MPASPPDPGHRQTITLTQIAASALAAASAAFASSYLGVAGTIAGAAVASVIATIASSMYGASLQRSRDAMLRTATRWSPAVPTEPAPTTGPAMHPRPRWHTIALSAAAVLALSLGSVTGLESILGKPISTLLGSSSANGTTLGAVTGTHRAERPRTPVQRAPSTVTTPAATPSTPTPTPSTTPSSAPTSGPTTGPTGPTASPTSDPTPAASATPSAPATP